MTASHTAPSGGWGIFLHNVMNEKQTEFHHLFLSVNLQVLNNIIKWTLSDLIIFSPPNRCVPETPSYVAYFGRIEEAVAEIFNGQKTMYFEKLF
jgi:hypothetical protein